MNAVYIDLPKIKYDTVVFTWTHSKRFPFFKNNSFYIKYDGINIEKLPLMYFWYAYLSIVIPLYKLYKEDIVLIFPTPVPSDIAELWVNYHDAKNIYITPISESNANIDFKDSFMDTNIGILFGGGKDSTYALSVLNEIYSSKNLTIISYVLTHSDNITEKHDKRRDKLVLDPLKNNMNINIQKIYSNFYSNLTKVEYRFSSHIAIFLGPIIPVILEHRISSITFSYEFLAYRTGFHNEKQALFNFKRSRPEYTKYVSKLTSKIINKPINIVNFNYYISEISAFKVLAQRYPERLKNLLMCEKITHMEKWCLGCQKCGLYVFCSMCYGNEYMDIDLNDFFEKSNYIKNLISITLNSRRNQDNNCLWSENLSAGSHYGSICHVIASINIENYRDSFSDKAFNNLKIIKDAYGNKKQPFYESFIESAFNQVSPPIPAAVREIVTNHCKSTDEIPEYLQQKNHLVTIDYELKCEIPNVFDIEKNHGLVQVPTSLKTPVDSNVLN